MNYSLYAQLAVYAVIAIGGYLVRHYNLLPFLHVAQTPATGAETQILINTVENLAVDAMKGAAPEPLPDVVDNAIAQQIVKSVEPAILPMNPKS